MNDKHIFKLTTKIGIYQFAERTIPNKKFGYSLDDQTRALILALLLYRKKSARGGSAPGRKKRKYLHLAKIYLNFMQRAQRRDGYFHNFANAKGKFIDKIGSQDSFGRSIWALGVCLSLGPQALRQKARKIFNQSFKNINKLRYIRSKAYALLGLLNLSQEDEIEKVSRRIANFLLKKFKKNSQGNWQFFEDKLIYANAILPYALLSFAAARGGQEESKIGLKSLNFLDRVSKMKGYPAPIGFEGWYPRFGKKALFGQQPIDACDMVLAGTKAFSLTKDRKYLKMVNEWQSWFFGNNVLHLILYDQKTGGCRDGIFKNGLNPNEGAESAICFHLSSLAAAKLK